MKSLVSRAGGRFGYRCNWVRSYARYRSSQSIIQTVQPRTFESSQTYPKVNPKRDVSISSGWSNLPCLAPPPHRHSDTLTVGVVSALNRDVRLEGEEGVIGCVQTDALLGPGNSGGLLLDTRGRLIGIHFSGNQHRCHGYSFAVDVAKGVVRQIIHSGRAENATTGVAF
jgi:hypothetical protein